MLIEFISVGISEGSQGLMENPLTFVKIYLGWSNNVQYKQLNAALDQSISALEFENNEDHSSQIMSLQQFRDFLSSHLGVGQFRCP